MNVYKVVFANNDVISCQVENTTIDWVGDYYYEHTKAKLIYAMIKAENETEAMGKSTVIINRFLDFLS